MNDNMMLLLYRFLGLMRTSVLGRPDNGYLAIADWDFPDTY